VELTLLTPLLLLLLVFVVALGRLAEGRLQVDDAAAQAARAATVAASATGASAVAQQAGQAAV
jgi:Flp pilus assembly protein TadG